MIMGGTKTGAKSLSIACFAITALLLATAQVSATTVSIADVTMESGSTITVPITIEDILYYGAGTIDLTYDPAVVHVTDVMSSSDSTVTAKNIDNTTGLVSISAWNTGGMSGEIIFANVTFTSAGVGSTPLNLTVDTLQNTLYLEIPSVAVRNGSIGIESPRPPTPFQISGYTYYDNGTPCNDPSVNLTNLDTGEGWQAGTSGNYYQITLTSGIDLNATETLRFDATDGTNINLTDHAITTDEVDSGGIFNFNLTLAPLDIAPYLTNYIISNTTISPNGDGIKDDTAIDVEFSETVNAAIRIENATGIIRNLYTSASIKNPDPQTWNGTDDAGNIMANGTYYINITMEDGVNPLVYNNTRSISVTKGTIVSVFITDVTVATGDTVTVPIRIDGIIGYGTGTTNLTYNSTVVHVTNVTSSPGSTVTAKNIDNTTGLVRISAWNTGGVSGDIVFANVIFTAVGIGTTPLNLTVDTLQNTTGSEIPVTIDNGSITVDITPPPANITYSNLIVAPTSGTAPLNIAASATVENTGGVAGDYNATLKVGGAVVNYTTGTLPAGANATVSFTHTLESAGMYSVTIDTLTAETVTVSTPANITSWSNDRTNDDSLHITLNEFESVRFNATADQTITAWNWFKDGVDQSNNFDNYTTSWSVSGTYIVSVNATNSNGTSDTKTWTVTVNDITAPAQVTGLVNDTPTINTVNLSWTANTEADIVGYKVYQDGSLIETTSNAYCNVTGLQAETTYEFNVSAYDDNGLAGANASVDVTTAEYAAPTITSWSNDRTNDDSLHITLNEFESVRFNATADQTITAWNWFKDGVDQSNNFDNYTTSWSVSGTYIVSVNATNSNGTSDTKTWTVTVKAAPSPCYIATATYGTPLDGRIDILRDFRDEVLITNPIGKTFVSTYYTTSPPIADALRENDGLRTVTRLTLITPLVYLSKSILSNMLVVFVLLTGLIAVSLFRMGGAKILRPLLVGAGSILVFIAAIFSLGFIGYAIPFCATVGAYMLPFVIPLSVVFTMRTVLKMRANASDNIKKHGGLW